MIDYKMYIKMLLKKKQWSNTKFCEEINKLEEKLGLETRTRVQNITNMLAPGRNLDAKTLVKWEKALGVPQNTICNMVVQPISKDTKKDLEEFKKKVRNVK